MKINILILSAGRRVELIKCFKEAAKVLNIYSNIITTEISEIAPAIYFGDKNYIVPKVSEDGYINSIINICNKENIRLIIPTTDIELYKLSKNKKDIEERTRAKVLVSDEKVIDICRNKIKTAKFFYENGFKTPKLIKKYDIDNKNYEFPLFIKPINGSSSVNAFKIENEKELKFFVDYVKNPIVQDFIHGKEYSVDSFLDFDSNIITIVPRERISVRGGEVSKGKIVKDRKIIETVKKVLYILKPIGHITIQCIKYKNDINFIEINPRFGGGAPMSIKAGANSTINLYKLILGNKLSYTEEYKENITFLRYDESILLNK